MGTSIIFSIHGLEINTMLLLLTSFFRMALLVEKDANSLSASSFKN
jgi:hypothetical protein